MKHGSTCRLEPGEQGPQGSAGLRTVAASLASPTGGDAVLTGAVSTNHRVLVLGKEMAGTTVVKVGRV